MASEVKPVILEDESDIKWLHFFTDSPPPEFARELRWTVDTDVVSSSSSSVVGLFEDASSHPRYK